MTIKEKMAKLYSYFDDLLQAEDITGALTALNFVQQHLAEYKTDCRYIEAVLNDIIITYCQNNDLCPYCYAENSFEIDYDSAIENKVPYQGGNVTESTEYDLVCTECGYVKEHE